MEFNNEALNSLSEVNLKDKLESMIKESGEYTDELEYHSYDSTFKKYRDDEWSGTTISYFIDSNGYLIEKVENDSPAQCGGWREVRIWFNNEWYSLANIADYYDYLIVGDYIYLIEVDYNSLVKGEEISAIKLCPDGSLDCLLYTSIKLPIPDELKDVCNYFKTDMKAVKKYVLENLKEE